MALPIITHLVDDTTAGGVMRVLDHIHSCPDMARLGRHRIVDLRRDSSLLGRIEGDIIVSHLTLSWRRLPWLIALRATHAGVPLIHVEHSYSEAFTSLNVPRPGRFKTLLTTGYSLFERVVAVSEAQGKWMLGAGLVAPECLHIVPSAVDVSPYLALPAVQGPVRVLGALGRLERQKGFDMLIEAMTACENPNLRLQIFGDGSEGTRLRQLAEGDLRIKFMGHRDPVTAMASVDTVLMPSRWEAYGLVALEARAAGRPLLVSPVDGLQDHVAGGATAVDGNARAWTRAITALDTAVDTHRLERARTDAAQATARFARNWATLLDRVAMQRDTHDAA